MDVYEISFQIRDIVMAIMLEIGSVDLTMFFPKNFLRKAF
jgi:hypothetical protein